MAKRGPQDISGHRIHRGDVEWTTEDDGRVVLRRPKSGRLGTRVLRLFKVNPVLTIRLDAIGSAAWHLMDGRTVADLLDALEAQFPEEGRLTERFGLYLQRLVQGGVVRLEAPPLKP